MMLLLGALVATLGVLPPAASARSWAEFPRGGASHEYSHSLTTFSPEGELLQLEHALAAANEAPSSLGLVGEGCVVLLGLEPEMPPLLESGTPRAMMVNENTVAVYAGLAPDARVLAEHAQDEGVAHEAELGEPIPPAALARAVAEKMQEATQQGGTRPFGASLIIGSCTGSANAAKPRLFQVEPSGWHCKVHATAIGAGAEQLRERLAESWQPSMSARELEELGCRLLREQLPRTRDMRRWRSSGTATSAVITHSGVTVRRLGIGSGDAHGEGGREGGGISGSIGS